MNAAAIDTSSFILVESLPGIVEWTQRWYEEALLAGFGCDLYLPDADLATRLHQYFRAGLTPPEAVIAYFAVKH